MSRLILVKHAKPLIDPARPAHEWVLTDEGRAQAARLAEALRAYAVGAVVTSTEPKAQQTGQIVADALGCSCCDASDLHEHDRSNVPVMPTRDFISTMALFFKRPSQLVLGRETARDAEQRFAGAIDDTMGAHPGRTVAVGTHGTVLALYVATLTREEPFALWRRLGLPSFVVVEWPGRKVTDVVEAIEG